MEIFFRNLPVLMVFMTFAAFSWIFGGARTDLLVPVMPWVWVFACEALLFFPQRRDYEDVATARRRAWDGLRRDPLFYLTLAFLVILAVPLLNTGLCPDKNCDYVKVVFLGADPKPPVPMLPFCVNTLEHWGGIFWFLPALTAMLAAKHACTRQGKRLLAELMCWNGAVLAVFGFIQQAAGAHFPYWTEPNHNLYGGTIHFFATFGYPNMGGSFFLLLFAVSLGVWLTHVAEVDAIPKEVRLTGKAEAWLGRFIAQHYMLVAAMLNFLAGMATLCRATLAMIFLLAVSVFVYYELSLIFSHRERARRIKQSAFAAVCALGFIILGCVFAPKNLEYEWNTITARDSLDRVTGKGQYHTRVATAILGDHLLFGTGSGGYRHFSPEYITPEEAKHQQDVGGANVHNDYLQFMVEHGIVGFGLIVAIFMCLVCPLLYDWVRLYRRARFLKADQAPPSPLGLYAMPAGAFWILAGCLCVIVHAFGDCPFRSGAVLATFFAALACARGFLPRDIELPKASSEKKS